MMKGSSNPISQVFNTLICCCCVLLLLANVPIVVGRHQPSGAAKFRHELATTPTTTYSSASQYGMISRGGGQATTTSDEKTSSAAIEGLKNSLASGLASCCAKTLLQPFDTIKTMQQHYKVEGSNTGISVAEATRLIMERGNGIQELYAGLAVSALGSVPAIGMYYGVYSYCKRIFIPLLQEKYGSQSSSSDGKTKGESSLLSLSDVHLKWLAVAISAALGNTVASFSRVPYEVVKQKLQTGAYDGTWIAITSMFQANGFRAFFPMGGVAIQMIRDIPYAILTLLAYEILRDNWVNRRPPSPLRDLVAGGTAGGFGSFMTNGLDVVKTRLQTSPELYEGSVWQCVLLTWQEGGARVFMRGSVPRLMHKIPANGSFFLFYEFFRRLLRVEAIHQKTDHKK